LLSVYEDGKGTAVGFLAQMPGGRPGELPIAGDRAGLGHACQAEIGGVSEHGGEHDAPIIGKPPFAGPAQVLDYVGRYTHRVAISNNRLLSMDKGKVRFR
jgi:hypothetical protein